MKLLLLYSSQTGFTEQYAQWLAQEVGTTAVPLKQCTRSMVETADLLVYGGGIRGSLLSGEPALSRLLKGCPEKPVVYFAVGLRPNTLRTAELVKKNNWGSESQKTLFYLRGGLNREKLTPGDLTLLRIYRAMLRRRRNLHPEDEAMPDLLRNSSDFSSREQLAPLVSELRQRLNRG